MTAINENMTSTQTTVPVADPAALAPGFYTIGSENIEVLGAERGVEVGDAWDRIGGFRHKDVTEPKAALCIRGVGGSTAASHTSGATLTRYYPDAPAPGGGGGSDAITDPTDIADCALWLDASTLSLADDDPVATWPDLSASGFDATQSDPAFQPHYVAGGTWGPAVKFSTLADGEYLELTGSGLDLLRAVDGLTIAAVARFGVDTGNNGDVFSALGTGSAIRAALVGGAPGSALFHFECSNDDAGATNNEHDCDTGPGEDTGALVTMFGSADLLRGQVIAATSIAYGTPSSQAHAPSFANTKGSTPDTASSVIRIGNTISDANGLDGMITDLVVYTRVLNARERRQLLEYLSAKRGTF